MNSTAGSSVCLSFSLPVEDDWPPVAVESLPFEAASNGYRLLNAPLFVKDLSVGDIIAAELREENLISSWQHVFRSKRTTIWLLRMKETGEIKNTLARLRNLGCNTVGLDAMGCFAVDVPESVSMHDIDSVLSALDSDAVAVAFPSMRHPD